MNDTLSHREGRARELLDLAARDFAVDTDALWRRVEPALPRVRTGRPALSRTWLAVGAAAAVAAGALTLGLSLGSQPTGAGRVPGGGTVPTAPVPSTTPSPTVTPSFTSPSAGGTSTAAGPTLPVLTPGMPLPANQRRASRTDPNGEYVMEGPAVGLGKVHVNGRPFTVLIVPATSGKGMFADGKAHPGACIVILPRDASLDARTTPGRFSSCVTYPLRKDPDPMGSGALMDPMTNEVDEFRGVVWPLVATGSDVAAVDYVFDGTVTPLPYRLTLPGQDGAVFVGFVPYQPLRSGVDSGFVGRGRDGRVLFDRTSTM